MNVIVDTNILVRFLVGDDEQQQRAVFGLFEKALKIVIPTPVFCETVWVLRSRYKKAPGEIAAKIGGIAQSRKVVVADDEVSAGLELLESGGDFADGVIAYAGRRMAHGGTAVFASFDQEAVRLLNERGHLALVPSVML